MRIISRFLLLLPLLWVVAVWAVDCPRLNYELNTQLKVDALSAYGCDRVLGFLFVRDSSDITNLDGLANITSVGGHLEIWNNDALTNLDGLANITSVGGYLRISNNNALTNLDGLVSRTSVGDDLNISGNAALTNLDGLANVTSIEGSLAVGSNTALTNLDGLANLTRVGDDLNISFNGLTDIDGLANLTAVGGELRIYAERDITNLDALTNLTSAGALEIANTDLTNVDGLVNLTSIGGDVEISANGRPLTNLDGLVNLISIGGDLLIRGNYFGSCQAIAPLLGWPDGPPEDAVRGSITIDRNATGCDSAGAVVQSVSGPSKPSIIKTLGASSSISLDFSESTTTDALFPITGYKAACTRAAQLSEAPASELLDNKPVSRVLSASGGTSSGIEVDINITHKRPDHLYLSLTSPSGTELVLWDRGGAGTENLVGTFPTTLTPIDEIRDFFGQAVEGDWVLYVEDTTVGPLVREGILNSWGLSISESLTATGSSSPITVSGGLRAKSTTARWLQCLA